MVTTVEDHASLLSSANHRRLLQMREVDTPPPRKVFDAMPHRNVVSWNAATIAGTGVSPDELVEGGGVPRPPRYDFFATVTQRAYPYAPQSLT
ncbi:hypothetical protein C4D60_Mb04t26090 [Musa balbisiana]|uniref:Uncharacterized protein n=1 Tax=Musa balbisiana TaxID=52838 RepID=A0A4S8KES5_MUSBA|nr:hypothetical protein C4D60_Mb04t26090 [Musa balbisiana]